MFPKNPTFAEKAELNRVPYGLIQQVNDTAMIILIDIFFKLGTKFYSH